MYMQALIADGFIGEPYIFNGFEHNYQWINPDTPMDKRSLKQRSEGTEIKGNDPAPEAIQVLSLEGYGAPIIDIGMMSVRSDLDRVVGTLKNMLPYRRRTNLDTERERINVDDADIFVGEFANGALLSIQSSYVTVGNYPGIEARIYGSDGALVCRLVEEFGECETLRVGVIGAGRWSNSAHLPGFTRSPLCEVVMVCDLHQDLADAAAKKFDIPEAVTDPEKVLGRRDIDVIDVVTRGGSESHEELTFAALEAGKHVLVEKPVCHDYKDVWRAHELARSKNLKTKVGLTFRYAPAVRYMYELIREGFIGQPFVFNGYEQNSQWLDPDNPMDKRIHRVRPVGEPPRGIEARIYGSEGALICRLVEEFGECETLRGAKPNAVEFVPMEIPARFFPPGYTPGEPWPSLFYANLVHNFMQEITDGGEENQGNFAQSAKVQEIINAVALSHREHRWVNLPLDSTPS